MKKWFFYNFLPSFMPLAGMLLLAVVAVDLFQQYIDIQGCAGPQFQGFYFY